jgi:N-acetyl-beta-hexosaminidase
MREEGIANEDELQGWFTTKIAEMVHARGKRCIGWDEVWEFAAKDSLPDDLIIMSWRGAEGGVSAAKQGHQIIMCPNTEGVYLDYRHTNVPTSRKHGVSTIMHTRGSIPSRNAWTISGIGRTEKPLDGESAFGRMASIFLPIVSLSSPSDCGTTDPAGLPDKLSWEGKKLDKLGVLSYRGPLE